MRVWRAMGGAALLAASLLVQAAEAPTGAASAATAASAASAATAATAAGSAAAASAFRIRPVDAAWRAGLPRDPAAATQAFLDRLPADVVARSNAYADGGYWLQLWNWLAALAFAALLLATRPSTALRDALARRLRRPWLRDALYGAAFIGAGWLLTLPLTVYQGFVREHAYAMATQGFGAWFAEQLVGLAVQLVAGSLLVAALYALLRRVGARWWGWVSALAMAFLVLMIVVAPIWIEPLFNTYRPVPAGPVRDAVLALARASGVPADEVWVFDASRQTTRISANVSGLFGTAAVRLNDNLLQRTSLPEIRAVMAHEIGHYALNHVGKMLVQFALVAMLGFLATQWAMNELLARFGARWRLQGVADVASLPLLSAVFGTFMLLATPAINTIVRTQEAEADLFSLSLAREPLALAEVLLKLTEYRKPDPGPWEEAIFFDHPGARSRIAQAMRWREQMGVDGAAP